MGNSFMSVSVAKVILFLLHTNIKKKLLWGEPWAPPMRERWAGCSWLPTFTKARLLLKRKENVTLQPSCEPKVSMTKFVVSQSNLVFLNFMDSISYRPNTSIYFTKEWELSLLLQNKTILRFMHTTSDFIWNFSFCVIDKEVSNWSKYYFLVIATYQ